MTHFKPNLAKTSNPMHSSLLFPNRHSKNNSKEEDKLSQLSPFYTNETTTQVGEAQHEEYMSLTKIYQNRMKHLQSGFERSKAQFQNSLKELYKQKIVLLNIISHNQALVDQFRKKLMFNNQSSLKQIETKYNIIRSGLFNSQLCPGCIHNISSTSFQVKTPQKQKESVRNPETSIKKNQINRLMIVPQYTWMYVPQTENSTVSRLKAQNLKLKLTLQEFMQQNSRKLHECNRQMEFLRKQQMMKPLAVSSKVVGNVTCEVEGQKIIRYKEKIKQLQDKVSEVMLQREKSEKLTKQLNQKIIGCQLQKINLKYKNKYF